MSYYEPYDDILFNETLNKYEFTSNSLDKKKSHVYQEPYQLLLGNFISLPTIYENILLYHNLGVGKSCSAITITEGFKEYINNMGRKIIVLVKNKNIQKNFINELVSKCTDSTYVTDEERELYFGVNINKNIEVQRARNELINKVHRHINTYYTFLTYGSFVNRVLGLKEFEKDEFGRNTTKVKKENNKIKRKQAKNPITNFNNCVVIVDEAHNITNNDVYIALYQVLSNSYNCRTVLLTATPMYDNPKEIIEISNLLNINNVDAQLPIRNDLFRPITYGPNFGKTLMTKTLSRYINNNILKGGVVQITDDGNDILSNILLGKVSYLRSNETTFPKQIDNGQELIKNRKGSLKVVYCQMSDYQYSVYLEALKTDLNVFSKYDITTVQNIESEENSAETVTVSKASSLYKNCSDASTMVYPGNKYGKIGFLDTFEKRKGGDFNIKDKKILRENLKMYSEKLYKLLQNIKQSPGNVFIYSNYVSYGGTTLVRQLLSENGYTSYSSRAGKEYNSYVVFDESINIESREKYRRIYNSPENKDGKLIKILIGSPIISEGITLKNVRQVHILEPAWNMSRVNQIIGRAVRNFSHYDLPESERNVQIYKYVSVYYPKEEKPIVGIEDTEFKKYSKFFIDREKYILSEEKDRSNKVVERILKEVSFDCEMSKNRNIRDSSFDGLAECDYQKCEYECKLKPQGTMDKSTYDLYIQYFDKFDITYIIDKIRELFQVYFVWELHDIEAAILKDSPHVSREAIYVSLNHIVQNKISMMDMYEREGFIINKGLYYIFNPNDVDIDSSIYSKILDFGIEKNKYTLKEFTLNKLNIDLESKEEKVETIVEEVELSNKDIEYNMNILNDVSIKIFGTYRKRGTKDNLFGPKDDKFRLVDRRGGALEDVDKRKSISGMWINSYKKPQLIDIIKYLDIKVRDVDRIPLEDHDKDELANIVKEYLLEKNWVLK